MQIRQKNIPNSFRLSTTDCEIKEIYRRRRDLEKHLELLESATVRYGAGIHRYSGGSPKEIGDRLGLGESGVSQASRRMERQLTERKELQRVVRVAVEGLRLSEV